MEERDVTTLISASLAGEHGALQQAFERVYTELRRLAHHQLRGAHAEDELSTTALVHEAYLKLFSGDHPQVRDRSHFLAMAARAMRMVLVDASRERMALKRGGGAVRITLADFAITEREDLASDLLAMDRALAGLERLDERLVRVVECRFFAGLTEEETGQALGIAARTVRRDWRTARAFLRRELRGAG
jgi:RNA polymerase sigma factor (TIGR02999 family)